MMAVKTFIRTRPVLTYFGLAFAVSWGGSLVMLGPKFFRGEPFELADLILSLLAMLAGPSLSGLLLTGIVDGRTGFRTLFGRLGRWRTGWRWYVPALLTFPLLILAVLFPLSWFVSPEFTPAWTMLGVIYGFLAGFFEEIGWMGFAYRKMRVKCSVFAASLILGGLHGLWHMTADFLGASRATGSYWLPRFLLMWCFAMVAMRVIVVWLYEHTQSVFLAQLAHASSTGFLVVLSPSPIAPARLTLWYGLYGLALWALAAAIIIKNKRLFFSPAIGRRPGTEAPPVRILAGESR